MKTTLLLSLTLLFSLHAFNQDIPGSQVPQAVLKSFSKYFPGVTKVDWEKKGFQFEAEFDVKRADHKALFDANGQLAVYKRDIHTSQLPQPVKQTIKDQYPTYKIDGVERVARNGHLFYQVELDGKPSDLKLVFTRDGKIDNSNPWW